MEWLGISLPAYGIGAIAVLVLYLIQAEIRFGAKARASSAGASDRGSTTVLSFASIVPVLGFALAMQPRSIGHLFGTSLSAWFLWPGATASMQIVAWAGVGLGGFGLLIRLWGVLTLRDRYTRTLPVQDGQKVERRGPYRLVRHPGYLGSLLCLNGIVLASCSTTVIAASIVATFAAYAYRIRVEDSMLVHAFGNEYEQYRREVRALLPLLRFKRP